MTTAISKFITFCYNYPHNWVEECFAEAGDRMVHHLRKKFNEVWERVGAKAAVIQFYHELDLHYRAIFVKYLENQPE